MRGIKINNSKKALILLLLLTLTMGIIIVIRYINNSEKEMEFTMEVFEIRIKHVIDATFFNVDLLDAIINLGYENLTQQELEILLEPIINQLDIRNFSFLPNGIVEYIYPLEGNEKAIGDNIFLMPGRKIEAEIAVKTKDTILCGPYELTQGGMGLICRKAIFLPNEFGEDELWGFVAIVLDAPYVISTIELQSLAVYGYEYELSASVNNLDKKIIESSSNFNDKNAIYIDINLPNGKWQLAVNKTWNVFELSSLAFIFLSGIFISVVIYRYLRRKEKQLVLLNEKIYIDHLTGIYNRKKLDVFRTQLINTQQSYAIFYLDMDDFKEVNDTYGHEAGDEVLIAFTNRIKQITRENDIIIRVGGDEFIVILFNIADEDEVEKFNHRLYSRLSQKFVINQTELDTTASIGYAIYPLEGESFEELLSLADSRMYENKRTKRTKKTDLSKNG